MDYDYDKYHQVLSALLEAMWRDPEDLVVGEDISDIPPVKIIFDGYGDLEITDEHGDYVDTQEGGNKTMESYAVFIHRDSGAKDFRFPEHELTPWGLIHRPDEEVCIHAWYDTEADEWSINGLEEVIEHSLTEAEVMDILENIWSQWFDPANFV